MYAVWITELDRKTKEINLTRDVLPRLIRSSLRVLLGEASNRLEVKRERPEKRLRDRCGVSTNTAAGSRFSSFPPVTGEI
jgi:hypothetical protein